MKKILLLLVALAFGLVWLWAKQQHSSPTAILPGATVPVVRKAEVTSPIEKHVQPVHAYVRHHRARP